MLQLLCEIRWNMSYIQHTYHIYIYITLYNYILYTQQTQELAQLRNAEDAEVEDAERPVTSENRRLRWLRAKNRENMEMTGNSMELMMEIYGNTCKYRPWSHEGSCSKNGGKPVESMDWLTQKYACRSMAFIRELIGMPANFLAILGF